MPSMAACGARLVGGAIERARERAIEDLVDERRLARSADAGHGDERAERKRDVDVLEVVRARAADDDLAARGRRGASAGTSISRSAGEVLPGQRLARRREQLLRRPWNITSPPCSPAPGPEIDQIVGGADRLLVVLDDEHGVAEVAQLAERAEQPPVVALVQADRRLVEHVEHAGQLRSDLRRQPDALPFAARQRRGAAAEREVADADVDAGTAADRGSPHARGRRSGRSRSVSSSASTSGSASEIGRLHVLGEPAALDADRAALRPQPRALAGRARLQRAVRLERFLIGPRALFEPAAQVGDRRLRSRRRTDRFARSFAFEPAVRPAAPARRAEQHDVAQLLRQLAERHRADRCRTSAAGPSSISSIKPLVALRPRHDRAAGERQACRRARCAPDRSRRPRRAPGSPGTRRAAS